VVKVAVDEGLSGLRNLLTSEGFEVVHPENASGAVALVTNGLQENMLNMQEMTFRGPVIDARGKTPGEILAAVRAALERR
jgi:hypothetical protein